MSQYMYWMERLKYDKPHWNNITIQHSGTLSGMSLLLSLLVIFFIIIMLWKLVHIWTLSFLNFYCYLLVVQSLGFQTFLCVSLARQWPPRAIKKAMIKIWTGYNSIKPSECQSINKWHHHIIHNSRITTCT